MATMKKVGGINEYEVNSITAANIEVYILHMLNRFEMDFNKFFYQ